MRMWLQLIRWKNLLIVLLTQTAVWLCVIRPAQEFADAPHLLTVPNFLLLAFSTMMIAAAGYIINDYFDVKIDSINQPEKVILQQKIPRRTGIILHNLLNIIAMLLVFLIVRRGGSYWWMLWQFGCTLLLWFYSTHFKRQFMVGNVVVAILTALTIIVLIVYEPALHSFFSLDGFVARKDGTAVPNPVWVLGVYAGFAFLLTWMREIVKDMEDYKGDAAEGCLTMPIKWGLQRASFFTMALGIVALFFLTAAAVGLMLKRDWLIGIYTLCALVFPLLFWIYKLPKAVTTLHYGQSSRSLKIIMVLGIGSLFLYYLEANG